MNTVEVNRDGVFLNGEPFHLLSGDFHYFRTLPGGWKRRLELMKDFGLTAVTTYVPWNLHEPEKGKFNFEGIADLPRFLRLAQETGLKVVLRFAPYMCAEWEMGGLPSRLLKDRALCLRSADPAYMKSVEAFTRVLCAKVRPFLYTNGGPIILVSLENEYGSWGNDHAYLRQLAALYRDCGIDVPFLSANAAETFNFFNGTLPEVWNGIDMGAVPATLYRLDLLKGYQPDKPLLVSEAWTGGIQYWGESFGLNGNIEKHAAFFKEILEKNVHVNFYMFCGGTNFGYFNGALVQKDRYMPLCTSYDYDAPISEDGVPREKYFVLRDVLDRYLGRPARPHTVPEHPVQTIDRIELTEYADLLKQADKLAHKRVSSFRTVCMEDLDQDYGFILYKTRVEDHDPRRHELKLVGLADRATVYADGAYIGCAMRDREGEPLYFTVPPEGVELEILVENTGRVNYGYPTYDRKGILTGVRYDILQEDGTDVFDASMMIGYEIRTLPLTSLQKLTFSPAAPEENRPCFLRGRFRAQPGVDTFLDMRGWEKGQVYLNGFLLGRYWSLGPQRTLYVPGELLKEDNEIVVFELHHAQKTVSGIDHALLDE